MSLIDNMKIVYEDEGSYWVAKKTSTVLKNKLNNTLTNSPLLHAKKGKQSLANEFYDVIIINGCDYSVPHPIRYRVDHQLEQLRAAGFSCCKVEAPVVNNDLLRQARMFIIFRCPISENIKEFIEGAHQLNKRVLYDIDDLVIDKKYTDTIPYVHTMKPEDKELYDDGVNRMRETLLMCDGAITTTQGLADELLGYTDCVYVNRNTSSGSMVSISNDACYRRDVLANYPEDEVPAHEKKIWRKWVARKKDKKVVIGYFSGSISHNSDFEMILDPLVKLMHEDENVMLMVVGDLDLPDKLQEFADRVIVAPFCSWTKLPYLIAQCDINIAPLEDTIFHRAKSENKWVEAALVKVPTVASNVGAFKDMIISGKTGILCNTPDEWYEALKELISDPQLRTTIGNSAYNFCSQHCVTVEATQQIKRIVEETITKNIGFVLPSLNISGGVLVALKHGCILQDNGYDVVFLDVDTKNRWIEHEGHQFPVLNRLVPNGKVDSCCFSGRFDKLVATLWDTLDFCLRYPKVNEPMYLVQNYEVGFYAPDDPRRLLAAATYQSVPYVEYLTISKWCENWLKHDFNDEVRYAPNGINTEVFYPVERNWDDKKIRILIEGDCGSEYKNVDEAFRITNQLDPDRFEIWYMCYTNKTKPWYRIDKNLGCVAQEKVADIYRDCHILLKTSLLESFSYPPLEMMSTGGVVVVRPNEGNVEYLKDGYNCLFYSLEEPDTAIVNIEVILEDKKLRNELIENGIKTAQERDWNSISDQIIRLYE